MSLICLEVLTPASAQLTHIGPVDSTQGAFRGVDIWRRKAQDSVWAMARPGVRHCLGVDCLDGLLVSVSWDDAVVKKLCHSVAKTML
jgi:hypothetical protein